MSFSLQACIYYPGSQDADSVNRAVRESLSEDAEDPRPPRCEKLTGQERYRLRQGKYRIVYSIQDDELTVWVVKVGRDIYR